MMRDRYKQKVVVGFFFLDRSIRYTDTDVSTTEIEI